MRNMKNSEKKIELQKILIDEIKKNLPANNILVNEISDVLEISTDSAYRRIRYEKLFNINEIYELCNHFKISFDKLLGIKDKNQLDCIYQPINLSVPNEYDRYMLELSNNVGKLRTSDDSNILMSANDIPIFHLTFHKELRFFKLYTWFHSVYNYEGCLDDFIKGN